MHHKIRRCWVIHCGNVFPEQFNFSTSAQSLAFNCLGCWEFALWQCANCTGFPSGRLIDLYLYSYLCLYLYLYFATLSGPQLPIGNLSIPPSGHPRNRNTYWTSVCPYWHHHHNHLTQCQISQSFSSMSDLKCENEKRYVLKSEFKAPF